jgi:hypothetical protein
MQSFIGRFPFSVSFDGEPASSMVSIDVGVWFHGSRVGLHFSAFSTVA